jgi:hypothetical protein
MLYDSGKRLVEYRAVWNQYHELVHARRYKNPPQAGACGGGNLSLDVESCLPGITHDQAGIQAFCFLFFGKSFLVVEVFDVFKVTGVLFSIFVINEGHPLVLF